MQRVPIRLSALGREELLRLAASALEELGPGSGTLAELDRMLAESVPLAAWAVDDVLLSADLEGDDVGIDWRIELRHGAAAYEAVVAHGRADGGGEIPIAATCVHVDEALSQRLGQAARSLAFAWVSPQGVIPATHIWPLRPTQAFQQWARKGHTFALLDMEQVGATGGADIPTGALPVTAVLASFTPMRKNGEDAPVLLSVSMTTPAVAALAGLRGGEGVHVTAQQSPREGAMGALSWLFDDEVGLCDASILARYVANAARSSASSASTPGPTSSAATSASSRGARCASRRSTRPSARTPLSAAPPRRRRSPWPRASTQRRACCWATWATPAPPSSRSACCLSLIHI